MLSWKRMVQIPVPHGPHGNLKLDKPLSKLMPGLVRTLLWNCSTSTQAQEDWFPAQEVQRRHTTGPYIPKHCLSPWVALPLHQLPPVHGSAAFLILPTQLILFPFCLQGSAYNCRCMCTHTVTETFHRLPTTQMSMGDILYVHNCQSPVPWAERGDGEGDKISQSLDNREIHISASAKSRKEEFTKTKNKV